MSFKVHDFFPPGDLMSRASSDRFVCGVRALPLSFLLPPNADTEDLLRNHAIGCGGHRINVFDLFVGFSALVWISSRAPQTRPGSWP